MPSAAYIKNLTEITVFSATSISMTVRSGSPTAVDRRTSGGSNNAIGCDEVVLSANVTVAPSAATALQAWASWSFDGGSTYTAYEFCGNGDVAISATGRHIIGPVKMLAPLALFKLVAPQAALTAALFASPSYYEGQ